jgi:hypothetical protein
VKAVEAGEQVDVLPGRFQFSVTSHTKCETKTAAFTGRPPGQASVTQCDDLNSPNYGPHDQPSLGYSGSGNKTDYVLTGDYLGPTVPSLVDVTIDGAHHTATIVKTGGMDGWVAWYVVFPDSSNHIVTEPDGRKHSDEPRIVAYDADGKVLFTLDPPKAQPSQPGTASRKP